MSNPFAARFREAAFTLEDTNIPEIAEMLHIASREIERLEAALADRNVRIAELEALVAPSGGTLSPAVCRAMAKFWEALAKRAEAVTGSASSSENLSTGPALSDGSEQ